LQNIGVALQKFCETFRKKSLSFRKKFLQKLSQKFCVFVTNILQKQKVSFRENFREKTKTKTFVPTLL
jgi:hypothetical protein